MARKSGAEEVGPEKVGAEEVCPEKVWAEEVWPAKGGVARRGGGLM